MAAIADFLVLGLVIGGIYALFSVGIALVFGVMEVINISHGELVTFGGYMTVVGISLLGTRPAINFALAVAASFVLGLAVYYLVVNPLHRRMGRRPKGPMYLIATLGLSTLLQNSMLAMFGADYLSVAPFIPGSVDLFGVTLSTHRFMVLIVSVAILMALFAFLRFTRPGMALRAVAQNPEAAQAVGINLGLIFALTLGLAAALAGAGGALIAPVLTVFPTMGFQMTMKGFAITILGGMDNVAGALVAAFALGIAESLTVLLFSAEWRDLLAFVLMIVVLLVRPSGLLGRTRVS